MAAWKRNATGSIFIVYKILSSWLWILYLRALEGQLSEKLMCLGMWKFQILIIKSKYEKRAPPNSLLTRGPRLWIKGHEVPLSRTWVVPMSRTCRGKVGVKSVPQIWDLSQTKDMQRDHRWVGGGWIPRKESSGENGCLLHAAILPWKRRNQNLNHETCWGTFHRCLAHS